jgi:hypothetical protein
MPVISRRELAQRLREISGTTHITFHATTQPRLTGGKKCPLYGVKKHVQINGPIGTNFQADVERRQAAEGQPAGYIPGQTYADYEGGLVTHKEKHYLRIRIDNILHESYTLDGNQVTKEEVDQYTRKDRENRQGLDAPAEMRRFSLENITEVRMSNHVFTLRD